MEEEAQKRNTDCVYFLASPLTCKKGNGCEFRHSEAARMNPRDCWYWIHSTCRNPNCSFRHPPLEGKPISAAPPQTSGTAVATIPLASTISMPATALSSKSKIPCYFFTQKQCAKGDKCPFLHGPSPPSSIEAASQQKPSKAPPAEAVQASNKPVVILKGHSSSAGKQSPQENSEKLLVEYNSSSLASTKAPISVQDTLQVVKELERTRIPETSAITEPYRSEKASGSRKSRATLFSDTQEEFPNSNSLDRHHDVQALTDKSRQGHPGRKQLHQHENERPHPRQALDLRYQNGSKSDVVWKNESSSLDGDGSDQSIQREDGEYSPHQRSRRRARVYDDSTDYSFQAPKSYGEGSDTAPFQHRQPHYLQHREQQVQQGSDFNGSIEHTRDHGYPSSVRTSARDGQRMFSSSSNVDLRDHLLKRRRDDRDHHARSESLLRRDVLDIPHMNHRRDENLTQQDQQSRATYRRADSRGGKWPCHDGGVSPDSCSRGSSIKQFGSGRSPVRASSMDSPSRHPMANYSRSEERQRGRDRNISKTALTSDARSQLKSKSVRPENSKEESGFAGPKSLAQIRAEKMAEAELDSKLVDMQGCKGKFLEGSGKIADVGLPVLTNNQNSTASTSGLKRSRADISSTSKRGSSLNHNTSNSEDFEGPKPLSLLLEKKKKMDPGDSTGGVAVSKKMEDLMPDSHREVEDGEVRDDDDPHSHQTDSPIAPLQEEIVLRSRVASDLNNEEALEEGADEGHDDVGSSEDEMRLGVEIGEAMSGDEDYGLDDDEDDDDFAKKLGGFFS